MSLHFSHRPVFPSHLPDDNLVSPIGVANRFFTEGIPERDGDLLVDDCFDYGNDTTDKRGSQDSGSKDILDLLPSDPFGMDISSTFTAITGWLEDLEGGYSGYEWNDVGSNDASYEIFAGLNFIWNNTQEFHNYPGNLGFNDSFSLVGTLDGMCVEGHDNSGPDCNVGNIYTFNNEDFSTEQGNPTAASCASDAAAPHAALYFALCYLGVQDLLSVQRVCKSLYSTVKNDPLLWRNIHIDLPMNEKITDDVLLQLTSRAQGNLQSLSLVECQKITDDALLHVLVSNPRITQVGVPGCTRLSIDGVVKCLKAMKDMGCVGIKRLRIGGLFGVTENHFKELKLLLGMDGWMQRDVLKLHFCQRGQLYMSIDDDCAIDIDMCPKCRNFRLVYDCPAEGCQGDGACRGCRLCVARCVECGRCISDGEYEETFCLELLCSGCSEAVWELESGRE